MKLIPSKTTHTRFIPQKYSLEAKFFWFEIDLCKGLEPSRFVSYNKFNFYSLYDRHYFKCGSDNIKENVEIYLKQNGVHSKPHSIKLYTNLSFLGYVFNPVSFFCIELENGQHCAIIQICNTFSELKPYFVDPQFCTPEGFDYTVDKLFYISPYSALDNYMRFKFIRSESDLSLKVFDYKVNKELELLAIMQGRFKRFSDLELLKTTISFPFNTLKIILLIHWHALILFLKRVPFFRKNDHIEQQIGVQKWKN